MSTKELGRAGKEAADVVARAARDKVPVVTGRARSSVRAVARSGGGAVAGGGAKVPYYGWLDFGGRVGRNNSVTRPVIQRGRFIYPALDEHHDEVVDTYERLLRDVLRAADLT